MTQATKGHPLESARVRSVITGLALAGTVSLESVAKHLETSPRTLQRRLCRRGLSFWTLVEESRFTIAGALLRDTDLKIQDIAVMAGYSTPSAFARAFTRWAKLSPRAYRNAHAGRRSGTSDWREMGGRSERMPLDAAELSNFPEEG